MVVALGINACVHFARMSIAWQTLHACQFKDFRVISEVMLRATNF